LATTAFGQAAASAAGFLVAAAIIIATLFWQTNEIMTEHVISGLRAEAAELARESKTGGIKALADKVQARSRPEGPGLYFLCGAAGEKIAGNLNRLPPELSDSPQGGVFRYEANGSAGPRLGVAIPVDVGGEGRLVIGRDIEDQRGYGARVKRIFLWGFGLLSLAGLLAGLGVSRSVLRRIEGINATTRSIMAGDLARRVPLQGSGDELDDLAASLNAMLARIEQLMNGLREVSDNIAHDLKTPLNRLRNRAEAALRDGRGADAYREGLERTIEEADELIKTFNALLLIARLEAGAVEESAERFGLGGLVRDVAELYEPVAEEAGLKLDLEVEEGAFVHANRQLVGQAVANLVDNAIKYGARAVNAPNLRTIEVRVVSKGTYAEISVADHGPGIEPKDRERALKRFVRLEASRTRPGTGLGLSLVAAVARLHGGSIRLDDNKPGLRVVVALPRKY
jgi:signal transduction histidine kinase